MVHLVACDNETCLALHIRMNRLSVVLCDCKEYTTVLELYKRRDLDEFGTNYFLQPNKHGPASGLFCFSSSF